ncbi:MAG: UxaA family hydrolase [Acidobacteriota bacterium]
MAQTCPLDRIGRIPLSGDNCAIATRSLEPGWRISFAGREFNLSHHVLEGHRFAVRIIEEGEELLSWGLPFGTATRRIDPGQYVCNSDILRTIRARQPDLTLPSEGNFENEIETYSLNGSRFQPGRQTLHYAAGRSFMGYRRSTGDVGTRNYLVILGTTSQTSSYARLLQDRFSGLAGRCENVDGIVAVSHTEGGSAEQPNNLDLLLRTLAGFMAHPNVGAVLAVDRGFEPVTNRMLRRFMEEQGYPLTQILHRFMTLKGGLQAGLEEGESVLKSWLDRVNQARRTEEPLSGLRAALQCGGSDAFSGISANPLAGWVAREIIRHGGSANLAETDELIGAESYVLNNVKDLETARKFLGLIERFKERLAWHGHTAEGNPSGGNKFRGLYNIALKSIGAARKRDPEVRLDEVIEYGQRMSLPGFYFMDSPGNDLESVAGQVASGANLIFFTTGNGSITNFPFVPTIKIVSTTRRYQLLSQEMDVNAGAYLDGTSMDQLGCETLELALEVACGRPTQGEKAGHSQVSIWRDWRQTSSDNLVQLQQARQLSGKPLPVKGSDPASFVFAAKTKDAGSDPSIGLILPTSLCSGQIARLTAERLNRKEIGGAVSRFVALPHTEGCGSTGEASVALYTRTLLGYLTHPMVKCGLLLEHGCEKTHNDYIRSQMREHGMDPARFGWASVQLDGGIDRVQQKIEQWFREIGGRSPDSVRQNQVSAPLFLRLALLSSGPVPPPAVDALAEVSCLIAGAGGALIVPENSELLSSAYVEQVLAERRVETTLAYGQKAESPGFYVMEAPTRHWVETLTGLGATGVELMLAFITEHPMQGNPLVPLLQVTVEGESAEAYQRDLDLVLAAETASWTDQILQLISRAASGQYVPRVQGQGNTDFQFTRGPLGVST